MYLKNNILYAEPYYILKGEKVAFQIEGANKSEYKEQKINLEDISIMKHLKYTVVRIGGVLNITVPELTKKWIKTAIIGKRYDSNDQMALVLNKDIDKEHLKEYNRMQKWRNFADDLANAIIKKCNEHNA